MYNVIVLENKGGGKHTGPQETYEANNRYPLNSILL